MDDGVIFQTKQHWIIFAWPVGMVLAGVLILFFIPILKMLGMILFGVGLISCLLFYTAYNFSTLAIRNKSILIQTGIFARQSVNLPISKIETVEIRQTILGALLDYGVICLVGTGGTKTILPNIAKPLTCRRHMERLINSE